MQTQLQLIGDVLFKHHLLWCSRPFYGLDLPWRNSYPSLYQALLDLTADEFENLNSNTSALLSFIETYLPEIQVFKNLEIPELQGQALCQDYKHQEQVGVSSRKWEQIQKFVGSVYAGMSQAPDAEYDLACQVKAETNLNFVDWCSGKGHLARLLASEFGRSVCCLEYDATLCEAGQEIADKLGRPLKFDCRDVLQAIPEEHLRKNTHHTALHACGQLHQSLLQQVSAAQVERVSFSPCCYHKISTQTYQPLSLAAQQQLERFSLELARQDIQLATEESVTGGNRGLRLRERERLWRVIFDLIQRDVRGIDEYLPVPSIRESLLSGELISFCEWAAKKKKIDLPSELVPELYIPFAQGRLQKIRRLELLRQAFRDALEYWLILDRVCFLQENGYKVEFGRFCEKEITPRNFLILAAIQN